MAERVVHCLHSKSSFPQRKLETDGDTTNKPFPSLLLILYTVLHSADSLNKSFLSYCSQLLHQCWLPPAPPTAAAVALSSFRRRLLNPSVTLALLNFPRTWSVSLKTGRGGGGGGDVEAGYLPPPPPPLFQQTMQGLSGPFVFLCGLFV